MPETRTDQHLLSSFLAAPLTVGEPDLAGALAVYPVFGPDPVQPYVSFAQGRAAEVTIRELEGGASIRDLVVSNPASEPVLLYEGEEVLGAQQNRTFDVTVLVGAGAKVTVPVSCVERGRWDGSRHCEAFRPAPHVPHPELRRAKQRQARERAELGHDSRAMQSEVWREVEDKTARMGVDSATESLSDVFEAYGEDLREARGAIRLRDGQTGAIAAIGGRIRVLDHISRPEVFAALHGPLVEGYALDALEARGGAAEPPSLDAASGFVALVTGTAASGRPGVGLGRSLDFAADGVAGTALAAGDELVALTAFPEEDGSAPGARAPRSGRIRRPSRRRRRQG